MDSSCSDSKGGRQRRETEKSADLARSPKVRLIYARCVTRVTGRHVCARCLSPAARLRQTLACSRGTRGRAGHTPVPALPHCSTSLRADLATHGALQCPPNSAHSGYRTPPFHLATVRTPPGSDVVGIAVVRSLTSFSAEHPIFRKVNSSGVSFHGIAHTSAERPAS